MSDREKTEGLITDLVNSDAIQTVPPELIKNPKVTSIEAFRKKKKDKPPKV
ncbi:hypothetical protein HYS95_02445 [Candidatus Daviesbacteria bacterium]|nr:hypothetical protein [Candidatus Daviesbacteria bacterium]